MSRIPPRIEQFIDGEKVNGYQVLPITENSITYSLSEESEENEHGNRVKWHYFVSAKNISNGVILWKTAYFTKEFDLDLEGDVQDIFPVDFGIEWDYLIIKHEYYSETEWVFYVRKEDGGMEN